MELLNEKIKEYTRRIMLSRMRILCNNGFYGLLLMHMQISLGTEYENAYTDGRRIWFNPAFLENLSDDELDFALMHEITHVVLQHGTRIADRNPEAYWIACDTVVNSNILLSNGGDEKSITLRCNGGVQMHTAPNGKEGHEFSVEELYELIKINAKQSVKGNGSKSRRQGNGKGDGKGEGN